MADYLGTQNYIGFMYYGERLIKARKLLHIVLNPQAVSRWDALLDRQSNKLLAAVVKAPTQINETVAKCVDYFFVVYRVLIFCGSMCEATVLNFVYGRDLQSGIQLHSPPTTSKRLLGMLALPGHWLLKQLAGCKWITCLSKWYFSKPSATQWPLFRTGFSVHRLPVGLGTPLNFS